MTEHVFKIFVECFTVKTTKLWARMKTLKQCFRHDIMLLQCKLFYKQLKIPDLVKFIFLFHSFLVLTVHLYSTFFVFLKEFSLRRKLRFSNTYIFATQCRRPQIFQTMNYVRPNRLSLKYQGFPPSDYQDMGIRKFEFVAKTQFL